LVGRQGRWAGVRRLRWNRMGGPADTQSNPRDAASSWKSLTHSMQFLRTSSFPTARESDPAAITAQARPPPPALCRTPRHPAATPGPLSHCARRHVGLYISTEVAGASTSPRRGPGVPETSCFPLSRDLGPGRRRGERESRRPVMRIRQALLGGRVTLCGPESPTQARAVSAASSRPTRYPRHVQDPTVGTRSNPTSTAKEPGRAPRHVFDKERQRSIPFVRLRVLNC